MQQQTLRSPCLIHGIGLHSGKDASISLLPAPVDTGIVFRVNTGKRQVKIPARREFVTSTVLNTGLGCDEVAIGTVEHLLAALAGLEVDNAVILTHGEEIPAMDGSAQPFVARILEVGQQMQAAPRRFLKILRPVEVTDGDKFARLAPSKVPVFSATVEFPHPVVGTQSFKVEVTPEAFVGELAAARTFGFEEELQALHARGLALGAGLQNAVGLGRDGTVLNEDGLRYPDEFVRHKILDAIGDMSLTGFPILAEYQGYKSGHTLHLKLLQALADQRDHWEIVPEKGLREARAG
ncbi:MAG: UDP-3-O-acyl-N-acetylglucosamine deacetylase [bacterium]